MRFQSKMLHKVVRKVADPVLEPGQEDVGLGDVIHGLTHRVGAKHCGPCAKKKAKANKKVVFGRPQ